MEIEGNLLFQKTGDGSHTLQNPELGETYHSRHGAIQEAYHVFIRSGFDLMGSKNEVRILEMGFGTGLNAFITFLECQNTGQNIVYHSLENRPLSPEVWQNLNYVKELNQVAYSSFFEKMHSCTWNKEVKIDEGFVLKKIEGNLEGFESHEKFDLIYFDAFGPRVQPHLWTREVFDKMKEALRPGGVLVTYSCKGDVKRAMLASGLKVEKIPGPPGKREMLRAFRTNA